MPIFNFSKPKRAIDHILDVGDVEDASVASSLQVLLDNKDEAAEREWVRVEER